MKSPIVLLQSLWNDFQRLEPDVKGLDRDLITIKKRFEYEGYGFLSIALPTLGLALQQGLSNGVFRCPTGFKKPRGLAIPALFSGMLSEIFDPITGLIKPDIKMGVLTNLYQICFLFKKTQLSDENNDKLHLKAVTGFFANDTLAERVDFPSREAYRLASVARFLMPKLRLNNFDDVSCKHGPGAVKEGLKANQKWSAVSDAIFTDGVRTDLYGFDTFATSLGSILSSELKGLSAFATRLQSFDYGASRSSAKLISVAKNSTSNRTITVEPVLNQFIQQGLNTTLRDHIEKCDILRLCLSLTDQSKNQHLALEGSLHANWATIDLKSASDLLSEKLVRLVFDSFGEFSTRMFDCRTPCVDSDNLSVKMAKFAGMGNALTFPVQSICFATLAMTAILDTRNEVVSKRALLRASRCIRVYGDDIIVKTEYAHQVVSWLVKFGLIPNLNKSFLEGNFKESCGVDAYMGVDITPVYLRQRPDSTSTDPSDLGGLVSFSNQCWDRGLYETAKRIENEVEERIGYSLPLVSRYSGSLGWFSRLDASFATRWCRKHHQLLVKAPVVSSRKRKDKLDGWPALLKFFHVPLLGRPLKHLEETSARFQLRIVRKWVPVLTHSAKSVLPSW